MHKPDSPASFAGVPRGAPPASAGAGALRALYFSAVIYLGWMLFAGAFRPSLESLTGPVGSAGPLLLYFLCLDGFALAVSAGFLAVLDGRSFHALGLWFYPGWWRHAAVGAAAGAAVISAVALAVAWWRSADSFSAVSGFGHFLVLLAFFLLAAAFEELMFRGYAWQLLADALGTLPAVVISGVLFGLAHASNPRATLLSIFNTALAGLLMCVVRARSRALWMPLGLHFAWNVFLGAVFQYPVSGIRVSSSAVGSAAAPDWLTGGGYGPEGSLVLTAVVSLAILVAARSPRIFLSPVDFQE